MPDGPVLTELLLKKDWPFERLYYKYWSENPEVRPKLNKNPLSPAARELVNGAYRELTGMQIHVNHYYLAESMTEAICCAEALGL